MAVDPQQEGQPAEQPAAADGLEFSLEQLVPVLEDAIKGALAPVHETIVALHERIAELEQHVGLGAAETHLLMLHGRLMSDPVTLTPPPVADGAPQSPPAEPGPLPGSPAAEAQPQAELDRMAQSAQTADPEETAETAETAEPAPIAEAVVPEPVAAEADRMGGGA